MRWETLLVVAIVGVGIWSTTLSPFFLQRANLLDLVTPYVFIGLMAFGLTFVVIAGEIDISVASTLAVSVVSFAQIYDHGVNVWLAALAGLVVATALGLVNGVLVGLLNLPSLAITLGTLAAYRGLAFVILGGEGVASFPESYTRFGGGYIDNQLPVALLVLLGFAIALGLLLHATRFGRYLFAIGSNREAAGLSGMPVARVRVTVFAVSGLMAGFAGIVYVGFFGSARADAAQGSLLDVVTAVVLGGVEHLRRRRLHAGRAARADPGRRAPQRHAARQPRRRHAGHRHRRAPARGDRRRQSRARRPGAWAGTDRDSATSKGGDVKPDSGCSDGS